MTPHPERSGTFTAPAETHAFAALLFDMDGTIIDSTPAIIKYWTALGAQIGVPAATILATSHGRRSIDVLARLAPDKANWAFVCEAEGRVPRDYGDDAVEIPGARALLDALQRCGDEERARWAIVTSGTRPLVEGWLLRMGLAHPRVLVMAEEVEKGKPDPECYLLGARRLGLDGVEGSGVLVLEDAPAGVRAGKAAGFKVVGLATTHKVQQLREAGADWIVRDLESVRFIGLDDGEGRVQIEIRDALWV